MFTVEQSILNMKKEIKLLWKSFIIKCISIVSNFSVSYAANKSSSISESNCLNYWNKVTKGNAANNHNKPFCYAVSSIGVRKVAL